MITKNMESNWHPFLSRTLTFITYEEIYGTSINIDEIIEQIKSLSIDYWIRIASMGRMILEHYESDLKYQGILFKYLAPQRLKEIEIKYHDNKDRALFHRTQFLALLRLALLYGEQIDQQEMDEEQIKEITIRCLLGISSHIYETREEKPDFDTRYLENKLTFNVRKEIYDEERKFIMTILQLYYNHLKENMSSIVGRYKDMIFDIPKDDNFGPSGVERNLLEMVIKKELGLSEVEYSALTFGIVAKYISPEGIFKKGYHFPVDKEQHFIKTSINGKLVDRYFKTIAQSQSEYISEQIANGSYDGPITDFRSFMLRPLVYLDGSSKCFPASLVYLQRLMESGLIWVAAGGEFRDDLRNYWGQVFEYYCQKICRRIEENSIVKPKYFSELEYGSAGNRKKSCDAILVYGDKAIVMEFKIKSIRIKDTIINADFNSLIEDINKAFIKSQDGDKAASQIDETIRSIRSGGLILPGINPHSIKTYYPVIVTLQTWPIGPFVYELIRREILRAGLLKQNHIAPVEIWSVEEFEYIEAILSSDSTNMAQLTNDKLISKYSILPMATFLADKYSNNFPHNHYLAEKREEMFEIVSNTLSLEK
ncbi:hypothetical protein ACFLUZ_01630 [Chloroflexota bacterium]